MKKVVIGIIIVLGIIFAIFLINIKESSEFSKNYKDVPRKNVYKKVDAKELVNIIENKTGIIYLGFPTCPWCKQLVPLLDKAAKYNNVQNVYYVDNFYNMRPDKTNKQENKQEYNKLVKLLGKEIVEEKTKDNPYDIIRVPLVLFVKNGKIIDYHEGTYEGHELKEKIDKKGNKTYYLEKLTNKQKKSIINELNKKIQKIYSNKCTGKESC